MLNSPSLGRIVKADRWLYRCILVTTFLFPRLRGVSEICRLPGFSVLCLLSFAPATPVFAVSRRWFFVTHQLKIVSKTYRVLPKRSDIFTRTWLRKTLIRLDALAQHYWADSVTDMFHDHLRVLFDNPQKTVTTLKCETLGKQIFHLRFRVSIRSVGPELGFNNTVYRFCGCHFVWFLGYLFQNVAEILVREWLIISGARNNL